MADVELGPPNYIETSSGMMVFRVPVHRQTVVWEAGTPACCCGEALTDPRISGTPSTVKSLTCTSCRNRYVARRYPPQRNPTCST